MKSKNTIQDQVTKTIEITNTISNVQPSPFLKEKVMNRLFKEKEEAPLLGWFTPKYQFAALICIVMLNVYALVAYNTSIYEQRVSSFAQNYELSTNDSLFN
ncbi:hypothetical protein [Aquimarina sp. 2201CG14-23]|uniref:hypothetical protein n=1 Tax=Aquimarina mycalae TaxID=3040073 RepID=UPI0024780C00|nr:hypothetical protein [Aquimarina sp. 2201CG14-23]MDH7445561.1 hypothetical protein [Aquimarina sp. 2201CG14-23]